jgi:archaemetzincin
MAPRVLLVPLGEVTAAELSFARSGLAHELSARAVLGHPLAVPEAAWSERREQLRAEVLLFALRRAREPGELALGLCGQDLYATGLDFVFGLASRRAGAAVVSVARLRDPSSATRTRARIETEAVHEAGHLLGLTHCKHAGCAMQFSNSIAQADRKGPGLCPSCRDAIAA